MKSRIFKFLFIFKIFSKFTFLLPFISIILASFNELKLSLRGPEGINLPLPTNCLSLKHNTFIDLIHNLESHHQV